MRIASLQKQSLIDWEGKVAAVVFTKGCNFRCNYCHNPSLVLPSLLDTVPDIPERDIFEYLESRRNWLDGVVVTGGEPTIHKDLKSFLQKIKAVGLSVKLDTNGTNPGILKELIAEKIIDFVAMDVKHIPMQNLYEKITPVAFRLFENVLQSVSLLRQNHISFQFRTTLIPDVHTQETTEQLKVMFPNIVFQEYRERDA